MQRDEDQGKIMLEKFIEVLTEVIGMIDRIGKNLGICLKDW